MKTLRIHGSTGTSIIMIGECLENVARYIPIEDTVVITDTNVERLYLKNFPECQVITIKSGEKIKTLETMKRIYEKLVEYEADRSTFLLGVGGGIVCDITGFVASTYLRGIKFGFVSTTLLSQVDASVGGKNGVNFKGYKNLIGTFNQPDFVICDTKMLRTLSNHDLSCGFGEIVKHTAIADANMFSDLESNYKKALKLDPAFIQKLILNSVMIKSDIVNRDEKEKGERRVLNFGHTFGHAIEKVTGIPHGEAVSIGMVMAALISVKMGLLDRKSAERIEKLLKHLNLPVRLNVDKRQIFDALKKDKKRTGDRIHFVLLNRIGVPVIREISFKQLLVLFDEMF